LHAATDRLCITSYAILLAIEQRGVSAKGTQTRPVRYLKSHPVERHQRFRGSGSITGREPLCQEPQLILEFSTHQRLHSEGPQIAAVDRRVKTIAAHMSARVAAPRGFDHRHRKTRSSMHGKVEGD